MEIMTHPSLNRVLHIFGDSLYMIGGSVIGAWVYAYVQNLVDVEIKTPKGDNLTLILILGIIGVVLGSFIREANRKE